MNSRRGVHVYRVSRTRLLQIKRNFLGRRAYRGKGVNALVLGKSCLLANRSLARNFFSHIFFLVSRVDENVDTCSDKR